jgi:elongation factor 1-gamma
MVTYTINGYAGANVFKAQIAAKYNNIPLTFKPVEMGKDNKTPAFLKKFPLGKVPALETSDGFYLTESNAIALFIASLNDNTTLLGKNQKEKALIHSYIAFSDSEFGPISTAWLYPIFGYGTYNAEATEKAKLNAKRALAYLNTQLCSRTFLVGERISMADIILACSLLGFFKSVFDKAFVGEFKHVVRWFTTTVNQPTVKEIMGPVEFVQKAMEFDASAKPSTPAPAAKKESSPKKEKAAKAKKEEPEEDLEAIAAAEMAKPKEKNPLDLLPKSSFVLDEWKRFYSNNDTRPTAVNWFWEHFDPAGYSIWKVDYKYNDELTQVFMSSNLVGGFYQRLERARKYAFGSMLVLGVDKKNQITGYFVIRGDKVPFEVTDTADYESYSFKKVDHSDPKVREDVNAVFAWDEKIRGLPCADGKVFK